MDFFKSFLLLANLAVMMMMYTSLMEVLKTNYQSLENDIKLEKACREPLSKQGAAELSQD